MTTLDFPELEPESQQIIAALLDSALDDLPQHELSEEALARFACGWVTEEESEAVLMALTWSSSMREHLLELRRNLVAAEASPEERVRIFGQNKKLGDVMAAALQSSIKVLSSWSKAWTVGTDMATFAVEEKRSLRSLLLGLGATIQANAGQPAAARTRGRSQTAKVVVEPGNIFANLSIYVASDESLVADAEFSEPFKEPKEISLYVVEPGGAWSWIGSNTANGSRWNLKTPQYGAMLGLPTGDIASHCFALSEGRWLMPRGWVALHVHEDIAERKVASPTRLRLRRPPVISNGEFVMSFELPDTLREAHLKDCLTVSISVGAASYVLGSWKVRDLAPTPEVELRVPSAGLQDCEFESHSGIQLTIRRC
jgi:hypothetical protein